MKLTLLKNIGIQVAAIGLQYVTSGSVNLSGWQRTAAHIGITAAQAAIAAAAHKVNPDGSPAVEPFTKKRKKKETQ